MMVLVDFPVWSLALRRNSLDLNGKEQTIKATLSDLVLYHRAQMIGPIRQEVLSGMREAAQYRRIRQELRAFSDEALHSSDFEQAAHFSNQCRNAGIPGSAVDFLICAVAIERNWAVFTLDNDFQRYARVLPLRLFEQST